MAEQGIAVDREAAALLGFSLATAVKAHYLRRPRGNDAVFEALNALAFVTASVLAGAGRDAKRLRAWFDIALDQNLQEEQAP